ncbi:MAG: hypothetical protein IPL55_23695 [Saprospiraceae bacterium]|jgi:hypothetical protein|nr:hypothetical protein [Saprospiraceae bacterium]MBL0025439.1 hypothetical protein [Saprospiraceae bacterium]
MRIIDEFDIGEIKVTVFKMNEKISIKFEYLLLEQIYKFRDGSGVDDVKDVKMFCSDETMKRINNIFNIMTSNKSESLMGMVSSDIIDEFDTIF